MTKLGMLVAVGISAVGLLAGCASEVGTETGEPGEDAAEIIGGAAANGAELNAIGALGHQYGAYTRSFCTGTLIAPNVVLTAKHCALENAMDPASPTKLDSRPVYFLIGPSAARPLRKVRAISVKPAPVFGGGYTRLGSDVAVYTLAEAITDIQPLEVASAALTVADEGTPLYAVGYGVQDAQGRSQTRKVGKVTLRAAAGAPARKAFATLDAFIAAVRGNDHSPLSEVQRAALERQYDRPLAVDYEVYTGNAAGDAQVCSGDSGGPLLKLADGKMTVVGVASTTLTKTGRLCDDGGMHASLGASTRRFIAGFTGESCALDSGALACTDAPAGEPARCEAIEGTANQPAQLGAFATCLARSCCAESSACLGDAGCTALRTCLQACGAAPATDAAPGTPSCAQTCYAEQPAATGRYLAFANCGRTSCSTPPAAAPAE